MSEETGTGGGSNRADVAAKIKQKPSSYKVCEGCGSIVVAKANVCPNCNAYRFDVSEETVIRQVDILAAREPLSVDKNDYF
ncbi:MAG: hypothetical protein ACOY3I_00995 [Verrucomicrobiota bacterium]